MDDSSRELYRSGSGDVWYLVRSAAGRVFVEHEPNAACHSQSSCVDLATFLATGPEGPQHQATLSLIGSLVDGIAVQPEGIPKK